jgi:hypothetical protein
MSNYFRRLAISHGFGSQTLQTVFDAETGTPELISQLEIGVPRIRRVMAWLRESLPLVPHSGVGPIGRSGFYRLPNHYRSTSFILPPDSAEAQSSAGVVVFKGTEPLLADFPDYFDWMLKAPFRASALPLALHFPMDMKLPPAAMWIEECIAEQAVSSGLQQRYLARHGRLARLPLPLFVFKMTPPQLARYEEVIRSRVPADGMRKIAKKLLDGLGVEVYYYPELPVRVADLSVGNVREAFKAALTPDQIEPTVLSWSTLLAEMLCLGYMPYAPWHHGMGGCIDPGNVCIDGGFSDLLTLVPFDSIPDEATFRQSLQASIKMLADSIVGLGAASVGIPANVDSDAASAAVAYLTRQLRDRVLEVERQGHSIDERLKRHFDPPGVADILKLLRKAQQARARPGQFLGGNAELPAPPRGGAELMAAAGA